MPQPRTPSDVRGDRRRLLLRAGAAGLTAALLLPLGLGLSGCASVQQLNAEVASFGEWPAGRAPGTYQFDPMPSQQADVAGRQTLEAALRPALQRAGFQPVAAGQEPDLLVQAGARVSRSAISPWDDPLWWSGGFGYIGPGREPWRGPWNGPYWRGAVRWHTAPIGTVGVHGFWGPPGASPRFEREVAVLLRDRASGKPLFEGRASIESFSSGSGELLGPLFSAALADFPNPRAERHTVSVPLLAPAAKP